VLWGGGKQRQIYLQATDCLSGKRAMQTEKAARKGKATKSLTLLGGGKKAGHWGGERFSEAKGRRKGGERKPKGCCPYNGGGES